MIWRRQVRKHAFRPISQRWTFWASSKPKAGPRVTAKSKRSPGGRAGELSPKSSILDTRTACGVTRTPSYANGSAMSNGARPGVRRSMPTTPIRTMSSNAYVINGSSPLMRGAQKFRLPSNDQFSVKAHKSGYRYIPPDELWPESPEAWPGACPPCEDGSAMRMFWNCVWAATCWAYRAAWIPWKSPSSQPTSCA